VSAMEHKTTRFHIKRGLTLRLPGAPVLRAPEAKDAAHVALVGLDFHGAKPDVAVQKGARVHAGDVLWRDRTRPEIRFTAPASGTVTAVNRGAKRQLVSIVIERATEGNGGEGKTFAAPDDTQDGARAWLLDTGLWAALRARPYGVIPDAGGEPVALFVTAIEGDPLGPCAEDIIALYAEAFSEGLKTLTQASQAPVVLCASPGADIQGVPATVRRADFSGSPACALPGIHIHRIAPVGWAGAGLEGEAWSIGYQDVIAIGHARLTGRLWGERVVALAGPMAANPRLLRVPLGASVSELVAGELAPGAARLIAGGALSGRAAFGAQDYLGAGHTLVTALAECLPAAKGGTAMGGAPGPLLPVPRLERVWPFDISVVALLRALSVGDAQTVKALGGLALVEEDVAALTFVCPSKTEYGVLLRRVLDQLRKEEAGA